MDKKEIIQQMQDIVNKSEDVVFDVDNDTEEELSINNDWFNTLPQLKNDEFLLTLNLDNNTIVCCVVEIDWYSYQQIESASFRKRKFSEGNYYVGEYECREVLKKAIVWIADLNNQDLMINNGDILAHLPHNLVNLLWTKYYTKINVTAKEANALYSAAISYFTGDVKDKPIPPIVIEIDMLIKFGQLSRNEIREIKNSEMQRIKLILKARAESLQLHSSNQREVNIKQDDIFNMAMNMPDDIKPPGLKSIGKIQ